jgi:ribose transport system substrate-binding protein
MRAAALVASVMLIAGAAGCGDDSEATSDAAGNSNERVQVGLFEATLQNPFAQAALAEMRARAGGLNAEVTPFDAGLDPQKQFRQLQDAVAQRRFNAMVVIAPDNVAVVPAVKEAIEAGVKVVARAVPIGPNLETNEPQIEGITGTVFNDFRTRTIALVDAVAAACGDKDPCRLGWVAGVLSVTPDRVTLNVMRRELGKHPNIKLVGVVEGQFLANPSLKATQDLLQRNRELDVIAAQGDDSAAGVERAVQDAGRTEEIEIIGIGGTKAGVDAVRRGGWYATIPLLPKTEARLALEMAVAAARGQRIPDRSIDPVQQANVPRVLSRDNEQEWADFEPQW